MTKEQLDAIRGRGRFQFRSDIPSLLAEIDRLNKVVEQAIAAGRAGEMEDRCECDDCNKMFAMDYPELAAHQKRLTV